MNRSRDWCFTLFDTKDDGLAFDEDNMNYIIQQLECCPETKKEHIQGYIEFKEKNSIKKLKKLYGNDIHWESRKGNREQAKAYCSKEESRIRGPWEQGEWKRQGKRNDLLNLWEEIKSGKDLYSIAETNPAQFIRYHKGIQLLHTLHDQKQSVGKFRTLHVEYIWGAAGTGKTRRIMEMGDVYRITKPQNNVQWWDGYIGQKRILIDDYDGWINDSKLLDICDGYELQLKVHGGFVQAKYTEVYFTSNFDFVDNIPQTPQMLRRITKVTLVE